MVDRIADDADQVVDDLKRKARRRLVGAIVLALAAAIILPMLLEKEPRPLGDDVSVQIPPVDEGKFINRLSGKSGEVKPLPKAEDKADPKVGQIRSESKPEVPVPAASPPAKVAAPAVPPGETLMPKKSVTEAEQRALSPPPKPPAKTESKPAPAPDAKASAKAAAAEPKAPPKSATAEPKSAVKAPPADAKAESKAVATEATSEPKAVPAPPKAEPAAVSAETKTEAKPESKPVAAESKPAIVAAAQPSPSAAPAVPAKADGFVVQLAAFADDKGANALANKLKKTGYAAFVEPVQTSRGTLWRVRVGGYASRPEADAARVKLKGEGYSGIVAPTK